MALSDYKIPRALIQLDSGNSINVRGLNLEDISFLVQVHQQDVDNVVSLFQGKVGTDKSPDGVAKLVKEQGTEMIMSMIQQVPLLIGNIIAVASDEPEAWENATRLPAPLQIEAVLAVAKLTFNDIDGFKKFVGNVSAVLQSVAKQKPQMTQATKSTGTTD